MGFGSILKNIGKIAGIAAAPFTGGASLALTAAGLGADVVGGILEGRAVNKATDAQQRAITSGAMPEITRGRDEALRLNDEALQSIRGNLDPYQNVGEESLFGLRDFMAEPDQNFQFDESKVQADPGFDFRMSEAMKALSRSAAGRGRLKSGDTLKSLERYAQGLASEEYGRAYGRQYQSQRDAYDSMIQNRERRRQTLLGLTDLGRGAVSEENAATSAGASRGADIYGRTSRDLADLELSRGNVAAAGSIAGARNTTNTIDRVIEGVGGLLSMRGDGGEGDLLAIPRRERVRSYGEPY